MKRISCSIVALAVVAGCAEQPTSTTARAQGGGRPTAALAAQQGDWVFTPAGWYPRSCVHEIPDRARVDDDGLVTRPDGSTYQLPWCGYPPGRGASGAASGILAPQDADSNWIEYAYDTLVPPDEYLSVSAHWAVPASPTGSYSGTRVYYAFPSLQHPGAIVYPAIQYGYNGFFGGNYWMMEAWAVDDYGPHYGTPKTVASGDSIVGSITRGNCLPNGLCSWVITVKDTTAPRVDSTTYSYRIAGLFNTLAGGGVVAGGLTECNQYPSTGVFFTNIFATDTFWTVTPNWKNVVNSNHAGPTCTFSVTSGQHSVYLYHNNPPPPPTALSVSISGPTRVRPNALCTWTAIPSGGVHPISYSWIPTGTQQDSSVTESFASSGNLTVMATDSIHQTAQSTIAVTVASNAPLCTTRPGP